MEFTRGSDSGVQWSCDVAFLSPFHHSPSFSSFHYFSSFYYFNSNFWYVDMHPTLAGLYPFLLGSPARCTFLSYLCLYICLGSPARSRLSCSAVALTIRPRTHMVRSLFNAWVNQKWPKGWNLAPNGCADDECHIVSQLPFLELITTGAMIIFSKKTMVNHAESD